MTWKKFWEFQQVCRSCRGLRRSYWICAQSQRVQHLWWTCTTREVWTRVLRCAMKQSKLGSLLCRKCHGNCRPTMQEQRTGTLAHRQHRQSGWWLSRLLFFFLFCWSHEMQSVPNDWTSEFDQRGFLCQMEGRVRLTGEIPWNTGWGFQSSLLPFHEHSTPFISLTHLTGSGCFGGTFGLLRSSMVMPNQRHRRYHPETWLWKLLKKDIVWQRWRVTGV